ncbi:hypothetical protein SANTM175S_02500 [Streptomyces antimycoticus]
MHTLGADRLPAVVHLLHLAQHQTGTDRVPHRTVRATPPPTCGRTSSSTPPTSCTPTSRTATAPPSEASRRARRHPLAHLGRLQRATNCAITSPLRAGSEEYLDTEKYQLQTARLGGGRARGQHASRRCITRLNRACGARHPALQRLRNLQIPPRRQRLGHRVQQARAGRLVCGHGRQPRSAPHPGGDGLVRHARTRPRVARVRAGARRTHRRDLSLGGARRLRAAGRPGREVALTPTPCSPPPPCSPERKVRRLMTVNEPAPATLEDTPAGTAIPAGSNAPPSTRPCVRSFQDSNGVRSRRPSRALPPSWTTCNELGVDCLRQPPVRQVGPGRGRGTSPPQAPRPPCGFGRARDLARSSLLRTRPSRARTGVFRPPVMSTL